MNEIPKVVFSKTLTAATWSGTRIASGDLAAEIKQLRSETGKPILLHGGPALTQALAELDLIDEYTVIVHPIVLAGGLPLFAKPIDLKLLDSKAFPAGAVALTYGGAE